MRNRQEPTALFESFDRNNSDWPKCFSRPILTVTSHTLEDVVAAVRMIERETCAGRWAVLMLSYEASPAFDSAFKVHPASGFPLAWVALFDEPVDPPSMDQDNDFSSTSWKSLITEDRYDEAIATIRRHIELGNTYQVNFSFPLHSTFSGSLLAWFRSLGRIQGAGYCAYLNLGNDHVLSLSPELFFDRVGRRLRSRPMKGTAPRGRWLEEDNEIRKDLQLSEKNRAENLMIVDLIRNDIGKISVDGSVKVTSLFEVERFRTVHQLTSTVESTVREGVGLWQMLQALFPCGSITGAPKSAQWKS